MVSLFLWALLGGLIAGVLRLGFGDGKSASIIRAIVLPAMGALAGLVAYVLVIAAVVEQISKLGSLAALVSPWLGQLAIGLIGGLLGVEGLVRLAKGTLS